MLKLIFLIFLSSPVLATMLPSKLIKGDSLYEKRSDFSKAKESLKFFEDQLNETPNSFEALWRASMANYYIGHLESSQSLRMKHYKRGITQGEKCVESTKGLKVQCYFWLGTNTALLKNEKGLFSMAFGIGNIISLFEKALSLDPGYAAAGPYRMLALLHYKAPGFLGGDKKKAYKYIEKSIQLNSNEPLNQYQLVKFLVEDGEIEKALSISNLFISTAKPDKFTFFESNTAFKNIKYFSKNKALPKKKE